MQISCIYVAKAGECIGVLKALHSDNSNKLIFAHININSVRNKFEFLSTQMKGNIDVLMDSKTKIGEFSGCQYCYRRVEYTLSVRVRQEWWHHVVC